MKATVTLITLVIIFAIIVSFGLILWLYISGYFTQIRQAGELRTEKSLETLSSCIKIEEAFQNKFFIRNCGNGKITNDTLNVYVDDELFNFDLDPVFIDGGKTGSIILYEIWGIPTGQHSLRIINPNTEALTYFEAEISDSAVLILNFDEGSGTKTYDSSLYHNDGTLYNKSIICSNPPSPNCPQWVEGKFGKALKFNGKVGGADYVRVDNNPSLRGMSQLTVEAWIKLDELATERGSPITILEKDDSSGISSYWLYVDQDNSNKVTFAVTNESGNPAGTKYSHTFTSLTKNKWYHVLGVYNGSHVFTYLNGNLGFDPSSRLSGNVLDSDWFFFVSWDWLSQVFNGTIDSVRIYNKALTPDETLKIRII